MTRTPLSPDARRVLSTTMINALGSGFTLPFLLIYLHAVRGIPLAITGVILATLGAVGLPVVPLVGSAIDRFGARRVVMCALSVSAVGALALTQVRSTAEAFVAVAVVGLGSAASWPAGNALLVGVTTPEQRQRVFAVEFTLLNAGLGLGGIGGGLIADVTRPWTFEVLYGIDAGTYVLAALVITALRHVGNRIVAEHGDGDIGAGGWRGVLRDRRMRWVCLLFVLVVSAGYAQMESGFPAFATGVAHVSTRVVGLAFAVNTGVIVLGQLFVLRRLEGRRRTRAIAGFGAAMAASWALLSGSGVVGPDIAALLVLMSMGVFALGETLWSPTGNAIVNDLAAPHLRGRYNALGSLTWQVSEMIGPVFSGVLLGAHLAGVYIGCLLAACAGVVVLSIFLERQLTPAQNGVFAPADPALAGAAR